KWFFERIILLFKTVFSAIDAWIEYMRTARDDNARQPRTTTKKAAVQEPAILNPQHPPISEPLSKPAHLSPPPEPNIVRHRDESDDFKPTKIKDSGTEYEIPPIELLEQVKQPKESAIEDSLKQCAMTLQKTLAEFGIEVTISDITRGPVITRYELTLSPGTKVQRITTLTDDIALAMKTPHIRIIAPIPGKSAIGIEVPNEVKTLVTLRDILCSKEFINNKLILPLVLGKDIAGKPIITDLNAAPHLLIAGATGSGKSVCINSFIMSLLYHASPARLKFLMVDPKKVELTLYNKLPHLLSPVITDAKKVSGGLNWVVREMDQRYQILSDAGVRNIKAFNALPDEKRLRFFNEKHFEDGYMPYIVVILDELADLMMVAQDDIEDAIARLAQLSRAVGIHLILATQRPSVNVITGVIKANFPVRISFKVSSKVDSRTVLDANGAEALLGNGDFLFLPPGTSKLIRGQGAYVSDKEIHRVVDYIHDQTDEETEPFDILEQEELFSPISDEMDDELYEQAVDIVKLSGQASSSILQRKLRVGYARAARLIDMMEANGIVGPHRGSKPRDILVE
ncbi:DNA translocase FtsK, partial [bacterium]|nr:DNA translocase FtsK [bacterium]